MAVPGRRQAGVLFERGAARLRGSATVRASGIARHFQSWAAS